MRTEAMDESSTAAAATSSPPGGADDDGGNGHGGSGNGSNGIGGDAFEVVVLEDVQHSMSPGGRLHSSAHTTATAAAAARLVPRRALWHYCGLNFAVNFVCWGLQPALIPLAVRHATIDGAALELILAAAANASSSAGGEGSGAEGPMLQVCTMASAFCVTLGHATTSRIVSYRLVLITCIYLCLTSLFLLAAFDVGEWTSAGGAAAVALLVAASRFLDGFFTSLISLEICAAHGAGPMAAKRKEHVLRIVGIAGSLGTLAGTLVSYVVVKDMT